MLSAAREAHRKKCERGFYNAAAEGRVFHVMDRPQANKLFINFVPFLNHHNSCCLFHTYNTQLVSKSGKLRRSSNSQFIDQIIGNIYIYECFLLTNCTSFYQTEGNQFHFIPRGGTKRITLLSGQNSNSYRLKHNTDQYFMSLDVLQPHENTII